MLFSTFPTISPKICLFAGCLVFLFLYSLLLETQFDGCKFLMKIYMKILIIIGFVCLFSLFAQKCALCTVELNILFFFLKTESTLE